MNCTRVLQLYSVLEGYDAVALQWLVVACCGFFERLGAFCLPSLLVADSLHTSRVECYEVESYTNYGHHTADVAATSVLLSRNHSRPRPRRELLVLHPELVLLQRRTAAATARAATVTTIEEAALGCASHICCDSSGG